MKGDKTLSLLKSLEILHLLNKPRRCQRIAGASPALESDADRAVVCHCKRRIAAGVIGFSAYD
jgi:hypothetical protein